MRRIILIAVLALVISAFAIAPAQAQEMPHCGELNAREYAAHLAVHAKMGDLNGAMNPGVHHHGYSPCVVP